MTQNRPVSHSFGEKYYRTEWRVTSPYREPRIEIFDLGFVRGEIIHERLAAKLAYAMDQLKRNILRHGETAELSKVYFTGKS